MRPWTHAEEEALRVLSPLGRKACAAALDRSELSVKWKADQISVSLRRRGFQPNADQGSEATMRLVREAALADLCPACAKRPIGVKRTGLCGPCHLEALKMVHVEEIAKADAQLELWAARSKLLRRRRKLASLEERDS